MRWHSDQHRSTRSVLSTRCVLLETDGSGCFFSCLVQFPKKVGDTDMRSWVPL